MHISRNVESTSLHLGFSDLNPQFDDSCFKITGGNYNLMQELGMDSLIQIGGHVEFVSAPEYFGDGYVMPIVAISVNGVVFLEFKERFPNFLEWLDCRSDS